MRPALREDPDQAGADQPADNDEGNHETVDERVGLRHELVESLVDEADLDLAVANLLHEVVELVRSLGENPRVPESLPPRAPREALRREPREHEVTRVRPCD